MQDARLAVYILDDLKKVGRINRIPTNEEILEFSALISQVKNKRFFDSRIKRIWEIETIDAWLQSKGLIKSTDAAYFTRLYDNWLYSTGPVRESGQRFSVGVTPRYSASTDYSYQIPDTIAVHPRTTERQLNGNIRFDRAKPVNLYWQTGQLVELAGDWIQPTDDLVKRLNGFAYQYLYVRCRLEYFIGWHPNSRTNLNLRASIQGQNDLAFSNPSVAERYRSTLLIVPAVNLNFHYYISPQVQLDVFYNIQYQSNDRKYGALIDPLSGFDQSRGIYQTFNVKLYYSLF